MSSTSYRFINWKWDSELGGDISIKGIYENSGNVNDKIPNGKVGILLHTKGIKLTGAFYTPILSIHYS